LDIPITVLPSFSSLSASDFPSPRLIFTTDQIYELVDRAVEKVTGSEVVLNREAVMKLLNCKRTALKNKMYDKFNPLPYHGKHKNALFIKREVIDWLGEQ